MDPSTALTTILPGDYGALALLVLCWSISGWMIERTGAATLSVSVLMSDYRREWMRQFVTRDPRLFDINLIASLRDGTSFLASACMIAIGGGMALIGNRERLGAVVQDLAIAGAGPAIYDIKLLVVLFFVANAFLKFLWAHRLFGYCSIVMASVPNNETHERAHRLAQQAAEINIRAAKGFNRGLRSIYFALGAMGWLLGSWALIVATLVTLAVIWRREYGSHSRQVLLDGLSAIRAG